MKRFIESLARRVMVAALAFLSFASHAQDVPSKTNIVLGQSIALTGPGSTLAVPFHQARNCISTASMPPVVFADGRVASKLVERSIIDSQGKVRQ